MGAITATDAKLYLKLSSDSSLLTALVNQVNAIIDKYIGTSVDSTAYKQLYDGSGEYKLILDKFPIISVEKLSDDIDKDTKAISSVIATTEVLIHSKGGMIELYNQQFISGQKNIYIEYTAGYATIPNDLKIAACEMVAKKYYDSQNKRSGITQSNIMGDNMTFILQDYTQGIRETLEMYRQLRRSKGVDVTGYTGP